MENCTVDLDPHETHVQSNTRRPDTGSADTGRWPTRGSGTYHSRHTFRRPSSSDARSDKPRRHQSLKRSKGVENQEGATLEACSLFGEHDSKLFAFSFCLTGIGRASGTQDDIFLDVIDRIAAGQQDNCEKGRQHQIYRHDSELYDFRLTDFVQKTIFFCSLIEMLVRTKTSPDDCSDFILENLETDFLWQRPVADCVNFAHHATSESAAETCLSRRSFSKAKDKQTISWLSDVPLWRTHSIYFRRLAEGKQNVFLQIVKLRHFKRL